MTLVGYTAVLGLLLLGAVDLTAGASGKDLARLRRARLAGAAAWLFGMGAAALGLGAGFSRITTLPPDQQAVLLPGVIQDSVGPGVAGLLGAMGLAAVATALERRQK